MIASAGILILKDAFWGSGESMSLTGTEWSMVVIFGICVLLLRKKLNPIWVMVLAGCHEGGDFYDNPGDLFLIKAGTVRVDSETEKKYHI